MNDVGGMLCTKLTFRPTVNCDASVRIQAVKKWFERCLLLLIIFGRRQVVIFGTFCELCLKSLAVQIHTGNVAGNFPCTGHHMPGERKTTNGQHEGKQDRDKKLQADPWNFPKGVFVTEDSKMFCVGTQFFVFNFLCHSGSPFPRQF